MRLGVLDVGSNTVHLLVVDAHRGAHPTPMHDDRWPLRLAEHVGRDDVLSRVGEKALLQAVQEACDQAEKQGCDDFMALATSAIREARNGEEVLDRVRQSTGVELQVLTGEDEARLTFLAVRRWFGWSAGRLLVLDIGGGSLEMAVGMDELPDVALSLPLGAGRMTRRYLPEALEGGRPDLSALEELDEHATALLEPAVEKLKAAGPPDLVAATSKTFRTLARLSGAAPSSAGHPDAARALADRSGPGGRASSPASSPVRWPSCRASRRPARTRFPQERLSLPLPCACWTYRSCGSVRGLCARA